MWFCVWSDDLYVSVCLLLETTNKEMFGQSNPSLVYYQYYSYKRLYCQC